MHPVQIIMNYVDICFCYTLKLYNSRRCGRPFMDVQHFDGIVQCEHICGTINGGQPSILQVYTKSPGEVFIQQLT